MTFDQLSSLIKSGYTQAQIKELYSIFGDGEPSPNPTPDPNPNPEKPDPKPADPSPTPTPAGAQKDTNTEVTPAPTAENETTKMLKEIIGMMQKGNINGIQTNPPAAESVEDILAKVINP